MKKQWGDLLQKELRHFYQKELNRYETMNQDDIVAVTLDKGNQKHLPQKINALPEKLRLLLFGKYSFHLQEEDIEIFFDAPQAKAELRYGIKLLSDAMGLMSHETLSRESLTKGCKMALKEYIRNETFAQEEKAVLIPNRILQSFKIMAKQVAIFLLVVLTILGGAISVNADFRERVIRWMIQTFKEYSAFEMRSTETKTAEELKKYQPRYIPVGFTSVNTIEQEDMKYFEYEAEHGKRLDIMIGMPNNIMYTDTENTTIQEIIYEDKKAYYYEKENRCYLMLEKDGYQIFIFGNIPQEELLKVADHLQKIN